MSICIPSFVGALSPMATAKIITSDFSSSLGIFRLPTDPLYYMTLTLNNIITGSRYRVSINSNNEELATGVAASTTVVLTGIPVYSSGMFIDITVRQASASPFYKIFDTAVAANPSGVSSYILQQLDE